MERRFVERGPGGSQRRWCHQCRIHYSDWSRHYQRHHLVKNTCYQCSICMYAVSLKDTGFFRSHLREHIKKGNLNPWGAEEIEKYKTTIPGGYQSLLLCPFRGDQGNGCRYSCIAKEELEWHVAKEHEGKPGEVPGGSKGARVQPRARKVGELQQKWMREVTRGNTVAQCMDVSYGEEDGRGPGGFRSREAARRRRKREQARHQSRDGRRRRESPRRELAQGGLADTPASQGSSGKELGTSAGSVEEAGGSVPSWGWGWGPWSYPWPQYHWVPQPGPSLDGGITPSLPLAPPPPPPSDEVEMEVDEQKVDQIPLPNPNHSQPGGLE